MTPEGTWGATQGSEGEKRATHSAHLSWRGPAAVRLPGLRASGQEGRRSRYSLVPAPGLRHLPLGVSTSAPFSLRVAPAFAACTLLAACALVAGRDVTATPADELFADARVGDVRVVMDPADLAWLLDDENLENEEYLPARVRVTNGPLDETFDAAGIRLRGHRSRYAEKKSFKIALDAFEDGAEIDGISKLNLIGEHNDPTIVREKLALDALRAVGAPVSRASHVRLYINGEYRGLYLHVEEVDESFLTRRFGTGAGNLYKCQYVNRDARADLTYRPGGDYEELGEPGRPVYELSTRRQASSFADLAELIAVINLTPEEEFTAELERVLEVSSFLQAMAFDVLAGSWDDYWVGSNNYLLYHDPLLGRFRFIPRDYDMSFGLNSINPEDYGRVNVYRFGRLDSLRPLIWRMMEEDRYRNLFTFFIEELLAGPLAPATFSTRAEELRAIIRPAALADTYRTRDFTYIDYDAFDRGYDEALGGHVRYGLHPFMAVRAETALDQILYASARPAVWEGAPHWAFVAPAGDVAFTVRAADEDGVAEVKLHVDRGAGYGAFTMRDDGEHWDGTAGDGRYGVRVAVAPATASLRFYFEARDRDGRTARYPAAGAGAPIALRVLRPGPLVVNELMAHNATTLADEAGEYDDWIELWNRGAGPVDLGRYRLADDPGDGNGWPLPALDLEPGAHLVVWADGDRDQGELHASFRLDADGEWLVLYAEEGPDLVPVDAIAFGPQERDVSLGRTTDGGAEWGFLQPTPGAPNSPLAVEPGGTPAEPGEAAEPGGAAPRHLAIAAVFPNPLREEALVLCDLPGADPMTLDVADVQGRVRRRLIASATAGPGRLSIYWDGRDEKGAPVPAGIYFLRLTAGGEVRARAIAVLR